MSPVPWSVAPRDTMSLLSTPGLGCSVQCGGKGFNGLGLFDSGVNPSGWGLTEWAFVAGAAVLLFGGFLGFGGASGRRRKLEALRAEYALKRAKL